MYIDMISIYYAVNMNIIFVCHFLRITSNTYHIFWDFVSFKIFDILMLGVDDFCQFFPIHHLLIHIHLNFIDKFWVVCHIVSYNLCNNRPPEKSWRNLRHVYRFAEFKMSMRNTPVDNTVKLFATLLQHKSC